jgi:hypothetical protein
MTIHYIFKKTKLFVCMLGLEWEGDLKQEK